VPFSAPERRRRELDGAPQTIVKGTSAATRGNDKDAP
jgi:hypothetical protein